MDDVFYPAPRKKARIEIIPLIDVVFFLLATFVLFTLSLDKIKSLEAPFAKAGEPLPGAEDLTVYLQTSERGFFYWKQGRASPAEKITAAELGPRLENYKRSVANPRVAISGDELARFSATINALDEVRKARIPEVSLETVR
jgi:biopolymer transport protein ExbD